MPSKDRDGIAYPCWDQIWIKLVNGPPKQNDRYYPDIFHFTVGKKMFNKMCFDSQSTEVCL